MIKPLRFTDQSPHVATPENLAAFQAEFRVLLPKALIEFCSKLNGGFPCDDNSFYPVPLTFKEYYDEYGAESKGVSVDGFYGLTQKPPRCSLKDKYLSFKKISKTELIPVTFNLLGNHAVLRADSPDGVVFWHDHELWEAPERPYLIPIAPDLEFFYNSLTTNPYESEEE
jgi:hypothetical protein